MEGSLHKLMSFKIENLNCSSAIGEVLSHKFSPSDHKISIFNSKIFFLGRGWRVETTFKYNVFQNTYNV